MMVMRKVHLLIFPVILLTGCLGYKELPVEYDYSYKGNFKKYRTFELLQGQTDPHMVNEVIEKSIVSRMKFLGYKQTDQKPHLLIFYRMYPDSLIFNGYNQPAIEQWLVNEDENLDYDRKKLDLKTGTLLIQFFDRRQNRSVWQGYSTSLYGPIHFDDSKTLRNAVLSILDKYRIWAEGFIESTAYQQKEINN
jgi:hypothetical protein